MSAKLGEMLLKVGALTRGQLDQVLQAQVIYGGRIGTNLVEMGLVSEEELSHVLSEQARTPCVEQEELSGLPKEVLRLVPPELVRRFRVVPLSVDGKRLFLAMADPHDFNALDEIGFATGLVVRPRLCTEMRLNRALERYYRIARPTRFIKVAGGVRTSFEAAEVGGDDARMPAGIRPIGPVANGRSAQRVSVTEVADMMAGASNELEVVRAVVAYIGGEFDRGGVFRLKSGKVAGVLAQAEGSEVEGIAGFEAELDRMPRLGRMATDTGLMLCELSADDAEGALVRAMGGRLPASALLLPVSLGGRAVAVICASDGKGRLGGGAFELQRVGMMAELSLEMLSLRRKIKSS